MELNSLMQEYRECLECQEIERIDRLLCDVVRFIIQNEWTFLLEIIFPFDMDNITDINCGSLVIGYAPPEDGFSLMIHLPVRDILRGRIDDKGVGIDYKMTYLKRLLPLIPCME